ncbi:MAG TPA: GNAT family N-acetyltransferase [Candidatus Eremiobacteraceae bacterium]|nr:GNAT family N-acetyltransferase [Candidatus Eremiobacteraceae bacterium]
MHHASRSSNFASIRHASAGEAATVVRIAIDAYETTAWLARMPALSADDVKNFLMRAGNGAFIADVEGVDCGTVSYVLDGRVMQLFRLGVLESYRRRGIGAQLAGAVEGHARKSAAAVIYLQTHRELGLVPYYERLGYSVDDELPDPAVGNALMRVDMLKVL